MSKVEILVFRHGETDWNRQMRFQGHTDIPLNDYGREQARALVEILAKYPPDVIVSSDLVRATETAEIANSQLKVPMIVTEAIRECRLGDPEGLPREVVMEMFGEESWDRWLSNRPEDEHFGYPNGERKSEHLARMVSFLQEFCLQNPHYRRIGLSTHGGSLRRLVHHCQDAPAEPVPLPNCVLYRITFDRAHGTWTFQGLP